MSKLSHFFGRDGSAQIPQQAAGFRVQTSAYGLVLPLVYGRARVGGNLIHCTDQKTATHQQTQRAGKGAKVTTTDYTYTAAVALGLCAGPIAGIVRGWVQSTAYTWAQLQAQGYSLFPGAAGQSPWGYLTAHHADQAVPYSETAYVAHPALNLPDNTVPTHTWELDGLMGGAGGTPDAHPADVLLDLLTSPSRGAGLPLSVLGDWTPYRAYCTALGLFVSPVFDTQRAAREQIADLLDATNSALVWIDGTLTPVPYGDTAVTGHGVTFAPATTPVVDLFDEVDFLPNGDAGPVHVARLAVADTVNSVPVEFEDRSADYAAAVQTADDQADIDRTGLRTASSTKYSFLKTADVARLVAQLRLQRQLYVRTTYTFRLSWRYAFLAPMDLVTLTDANQGLQGTPVRITRIEEAGAPEDGLEITAEDWPVGTASATRYAVASGAAASVSRTSDPGPTQAAVLVAPSALTSAALELWIVANGGPAWGGCEVWLSPDGATYQRAAVCTARGTLGRLTAALASGPVDPTQDTTHVLAIDLTAGGTLTPGAALATVTDDALAAGQTLWAVGTGTSPELLAWRDATLTGLGQYTLATLRRGLYGSPVASSAPVGALTAALDDAVVRVPLPQAQAGQTYYVKLPAFNAYGNGLQDLASCAAIPVVLTTSALPRGLVPIVVTPRVVGAAGGALVVAVDAPDPLGLVPTLVRLDGATGVPGGTSAVSGLGTDVSPYQIPQPAAGSADGLVTFRATAAGRLDGTATLAIPAQIASSGGGSGGGGGGASAAAITGVRTVVNRSASSVTVSWTVSGAPGGATYTVLARVAGDGSSGTAIASGGATLSAVDDERANGYTFYVGGKSSGTSVVFEYQVTMQSAGATVASSGWYATPSISLAYGGAV